MNIALIGMPAAGKSFIGKQVAERLGYAFVDPDNLIEAETKKPLQQVLEELGDEAFLVKEWQVLKSATRGRNNQLISPGGSIIYTDAAMDYLADIGFIVYLFAPVQVLIERMNQQPRGIVGANTKTLAELFAERDSLYRTWANATVNANQDPEAVVEEIMGVLPQ